MRRTRLVPSLVAAFVAGGLALAAIPAPSQEKKAGGMEDMPPMPEPTEQHKHLQKQVGEWEGTITMLLPGMPNTPTPAKETVRSLGGFWTVSDFQCDFMGMPYQGHGTNGYDAQKGKYVGTWIDSFGSPLAVMEGEWDDASQMVVWKWEAPDMTGQVVPHRSQVKIGKDSYKMDFYTDGEHSMVIEMKRKGGM